MANDPIAALRQDAQAQQERDMVAALATLPHDGPLPAPTIPFSTSNDAALAAHLKETREQSLEYLRLQTEDARQQYLSAAADNFRRTQQAQQEGAIRGAIEREQTTARDMAESARIMSELSALGADPEIANNNPWTAPLDKLRETANTLQKAERLSARYPQQQPAQQPAQQQTRAETFPDGQPVHVTQNQDGTMTVEYATGEKFSGDPLTVTQEIGKAHVSTKVWARQKAAQVQPTQPTQQQVLPPEPTPQNSIADYWADQTAQALAKQFGFSDKTEMLKWGENVTQTVEQLNDQNVALEFMAHCPDFPETEQANNAVLSIIERNGWDTSAETLQAAHALAVRQGLYAPLSADAIQAANGNAPQAQRVTAPPMIHGNNPEYAHAAKSPYEMPMADLRAAAIKQQLEQGGPRT